MNAFETAHPEGQRLFTDIISRLERAAGSMDVNHPKDTTSVSAKKTIKIGFFFFRKRSPSLKVYFLSSEHTTISPSGLR